MKGYLYDKNLTKKSFKGNFFLTGDLGYKDRQNYYYINKRSDKTIKRYGFKVNLNQIVSIVKKLKVVEDCKIFIDDKKKLILIAQIRNKNYKNVDLQAELKKHFTNYEIPDEIILTKKVLNSFNKKISVENLYQRLNKK